MTRIRAAASIAMLVSISLLLGCASTAPPEQARPGTTGAITRAAADYLEIAGDDIFGDVAAGGGWMWVATLEGLIQVDPATMDATWHTDLAPGKKIVYAFDSVWVGGPRGLIRVDPVSLEETARIQITEPEGVTADADSIWTSQHRARVVLRVDPSTNKVVDTIEVASTDFPPGSPMRPSVVDGQIWVAMGNSPEVLRIDPAGEVVRVDAEREVLTPPVATPHAVWFSSWHDRRVTRIDRATGIVSSAEIPESALAHPGVVGPAIYVDDTLWFTTSGGVMVALDPVTFDVVGAVASRGSMPRNIVAYEDAVWLMSEFDGSLERIPLDRLADAVATQ